MSLLLLFNQSTGVAANASVAAGTGTAGAPTTVLTPPTGVPTLTLRIDWANKGTFTGAFDTVIPLSTPGVVKSRGASADLGTEADGSLTFELDNVSDRYTPDRNWADNPSFEAGVEGWYTAAIPGLTAAATSITQVVDNAPSAGTKAGSAVLTATLNSAVFYRLPYSFTSGVPYAFEIYVKSTSGTLNVRCGLASEGTPTDQASSGSDITTSWAAYSGTWTPSADRSDVVVFVRTTNASAATVRIDRVQVNAGSTVNAYQEAPTKGLLTPGRPVHLYASWAGSDWPQFYGFVDRFTPEPERQVVSVTCSDVLGRMGETDVVIPAAGALTRSAREFRSLVLGEFDRGTRNLLPNPSFETNTTGWTVSGGTLTRVTTEGAPGAGTSHATVATTGSGQTVQAIPYLAAALLAGQTHRFSIYVRCASGTQPWTLGFGRATVASTYTITVTTTWQRVTITYAPSSTVGPADADPVRAYLTSQLVTGGTILIDGAMVTRGQALHPYSDAGTGRWPNWVGNDTFDGGSLTGWTDPFKNLIGNPSFETDLSGWTAGNNSYSGGAATLTRQVSDPKYGSASATLQTGGAAGYGAYYVIPGTFLAGVTYYFQVWGHASTGTINAVVWLGSNGTPSDVASAPNGAIGTTYTLLSNSWTPTVDRTDVHFTVVNYTASSILVIDGASVVRPVAPYSDTGPGGGAGLPTSSTTTTTVAKYGYRSQEVVTPATANVGRLYDFNHQGPVFVSGQQYAVSLWLYPTSSMPYKVGIGSNADTGAWDEASTTGTAAANVWTQITMTWTPTADRDAGTELETVLFVYQTDATARTFRIDGVRVNPGAAAESFEAANWVLPTTGGEAQDVYLSTAELSGTVLGSLETLNELTLSRHWIRPTMASPWYEYVVDDRDAFAARASSQTFGDAGRDIDGWENLDIDRDALTNVVGVSWGGSAANTEYYSDAASVGRHGPRPGPTIDGSGFYDGRGVPDVIGAALVARYGGVIRIRPTMRVMNQYAKQLDVDLNDVVTVTIARFLLRSGQFVVLREDLTISGGDAFWVTEWKLEEFPY